jgi:hypothetical protein
MNEGDSKKTKQIKGKGTSIDVLQRYITNVSDVLSTIGLRCTIQTNDGTDRFVLGSRRYLLLNFRLFLVGVYISYEIFK